VRELTERWHHQQQIRQATGRAGIMTPELYHPALDCFMRRLPQIASHTTTGNRMADIHERNVATALQALALIAIVA